jgi:hypothetical protein
MKLLSFLTLFLLSFFYEKPLTTKPTFTSTIKFRSMQGVPGLPSFASFKSGEIKYRFKKGESLNTYHNIKLKGINLSAADLYTYPTDLESIKIFISTPTKREIQLSSTLIDNGVMQDYLLKFNDKVLLDEYLSDANLEYRVEFVTKKAYREFNYKLDFEFIGEPININKE